MDDLNAFIVAAKAACHVGEGRSSSPAQPDARDLTFAKGTYEYPDKSDGGFCGFTGVETIHSGDLLVYRLDYHGGMIVS